MTRLSRHAAGLNPGAFALVMATGIVSIGASLLGMRVAAAILLWANAVFFVAVWLLTVIRLAAHSRALWADFRDHGRGPGFFTAVAGTCVLGSQVAIITARYPLALGLWVLGTLLWVGLSYTFLPAVMTREPKPALDTAMHGGWLIIVVATQSVSVLASLLAPGYRGAAGALLFTALVLFLAGSLLYIVIITLLVLRLVFQPLTPAGVPPVSWVAMGAAAISTLAGARLMLDAGLWRFLVDMLPFLKGFTLVFWATATWWIPLLAALGAWRHLARRFPLRYETPYWSLVFPLGMYTVSTAVLSRAEGLAFLAVVPRFFIWIALAAWLATFVGMVLFILGRPLAPGPAAAATANRGRTARTRR